MRQAEQRLWDTFKRNLQNDVWAQRVENVVASGMPDVLITNKAGIHDWFELKCFDVPKRFSTCCLKKGDVRQEQVNWHLRAARMNCRSWLLVRDSNGTLYLAPGMIADIVHTMAMPDWSFFEVTWKDVRELLDGGRYTRFEAAAALRAFRK